MASAIPVPGQPGRLWIPGIGVVDQSREGNMKLYNYEGEAAAAAAAQDSLGQFRVALRPDIMARAAAVGERGDLVQRAVLPEAVRATLVKVQQATAADAAGMTRPAAGGAVDKIPTLPTDLLVEIYKAGLKGESFQDESAEKVQSLMPRLSAELQRRGVDLSAITVGFDWTNPWFLGGVAAVALGGVWFVMRRR